MRIGVLETLQIVNVSDVCSAVMPAKVANYWNDRVYNLIMTKDGAHYSSLHVGKNYTYWTRPIQWLPYFELVFV